MIPKIIHHCCFSGKLLAEDARQDNATWSKFCHGYEIKEYSKSKLK